MWAILEQMRDHATTIVGLVTALTQKEFIIGLIETALADAADAEAAE